MFTYNITFVVSPEKENELIEYIRREFIPRVFGENLCARDPQLRKLIEIGREAPDSEHGLSIALAATFPTEESAHQWYDHTLLPALTGFLQKFGQHALYFTTLLQDLSL